MLNRSFHTVELYSLDSAYAGGATFRFTLTADGEGLKKSEVGASITGTMKHEMGAED